MRFIDYIRRNPICFNGDTDKFDFDATPLITGTTVFDVGEVASQIIERTEEQPGGGRHTVFTEKGKELVKLKAHDSLAGAQTLDLAQFVGIIPPFDNCFFEYDVTAYDGSGVIDAGVHLDSLSKDEIASQFPDQGFGFVMLATVFYRHIVNGNSINARETVGVIASDEEGQLVDLKLTPCWPKSGRPQDMKGAQQTPVLVTLVSLMMLHYKFLKSTLSPEIVKTRQQRRFEERHPARTAPPFARYYILSINPETTQPGDGSSGKGGWEVAWHRVRGHLRHLKSGKVVPVRAHSKGNPLKGVIVKDYEINSHTEKKTGTVTNV